MADFAEFDPLVSPITNGQASETKQLDSSSSVPASKITPIEAKKFTGVSDDFLYSSKWHPLNVQSSPAAVLHISFRPAQGHVEEDAVHKLQREAEEKAAREASERAEREAAEKQRQEEAIAAAAAGKEQIGADAVKVSLPSPKLDTAPAKASEMPAVDPSIIKQQKELEKLTSKHEKEEQLRMKYVGKKTFAFKKTEQENAANTVEWQGVFELKGNNITLTEVTKKTGTEENAKVVEVQGTCSLSVSADGKKLTGKIEDEVIEFELLDSDPNKALEQLLLG